LTIDIDDEDAENDGAMSEHLQRYRKYIDSLKQGRSSGISSVFGRASDLLPPDVLEIKPPTVVANRFPKDVAGDLETGSNGNHINKEATQNKVIDHASSSEIETTADASAYFGEQNDKIGRNKSRAYSEELVASRLAKHKSGEVQSDEVVDAERGGENIVGDDDGENDIDADDADEDDDSGVDDDAEDQDACDDVEDEDSSGDIVDEEEVDDNDDEIDDDDDDDEIAEDVDDLVGEDDDDELDEFDDDQINEDADADDDEDYVASGKNLGGEVGAQHHHHGRTDPNQDATTEELTVKSAQGAHLWTIFFNRVEPLFIKMSDGSSIKNAEGRDDTILALKTNGEQFKFFILSGLVIDPITGNIYVEANDGAFTAAFMNNGWQIQQYRNHEGEETYYATEPFKPGRDRLTMQITNVALDPVYGEVSYDSLDGAVSMTLKSRKLLRSAET
jgi:hypothetical protein